MVDGGDRGRGAQHLPITVEGQEGERPKNVEVGLDAAAAQMNEQGGGQHLGGSDDVASQRVPRVEERQQDRERRDRAPEENRRQDVQMHGADRSDPGRRGDPQCQADAREPLPDHQTGEQPIRAFPGPDTLGPVKVLRHLREMRGLGFGLGDGDEAGQGRTNVGDRDHVQSVEEGSSSSGQPKTGVR